MSDADDFAASIGATPAEPTRENARPIARAPQFDPSKPFTVVPDGGAAPKHLRDINPSDILSVEAPRNGSDQGFDPDKFLAQTAPDFISDADMAKLESRLAAAKQQRCEEMSGKQGIYVGAGTVAAIAAVFYLGFALGRRR